MTKNVIMKKIINRAKAPTPKFFKVLRTVGLALAAVGGTILAAPINQVNAVTANSTKPLFLALGVEFYQEINGQMYPLKNGAFNPLSIAKVDSGV